MAEDKVKPYHPYYCSPPNKLIRYEVRDFDDGHGNGGKCRWAIYTDKKGKQCEMVAQVIWEYGHAV
jgi:hypothetical protein